jgi:hypothetical protein
MGGRICVLEPPIGFNPKFVKHVFKLEATWQEIRQCRRGNEFHWCPIDSKATKAEDYYT